MIRLYPGIRKKLRDQYGDRVESTLEDITNKFNIEPRDIENILLKMIFGELPSELDTFAKHLERHAVKRVLRNTDGT